MKCDDIIHKIQYSKQFGYAIQYDNITYFKMALRVNGLSLTESDTINLFNECKERKHDKTIQP